jgi:hypothetical protein
VASANAQLWLATSWIPIATMVRRGKRAVAVVVPVLVLLAMTLLVATSHPPRVVAQETVLGLPLTGRSATSFPASDLFVVNGTTGRDGGMTDLLHLMGTQGVRFYQAATSGVTAGPDGLFGKADVVLIKVNGQWDQRGGTNTDLLFAVVAAVAAHPEGFTGEIVVADNGQAQYGSAGSGGSLDWTDNNAANPAQSVQDVVDALASACNVSTYRWDDITLQRVDEYHEGDLGDGYVVNATAHATTGVMVSYPKFRTAHGTYVSFKRGVWDPVSSTYDGARLKVINLPVLKTHSGYGVTACVKHYMGVVSDKLTSSLGARSHDTIGRGGMGTAMAETRVPTLNLLDAIWINAAPRNGPSTSYGEAVQVRVLAASRDPVALDYWAAKYVLKPAAAQLGYTDLTSLDPDYTETWGAFGNWLRRSQQALSDAGYSVTADEARMNVFVHHAADDDGTVTSHTVAVEGDDFTVTIHSNSQISDFAFHPSDRLLRFNATGTPGTFGFCNVTFPTPLLGGPYLVLINGSTITPDVSFNATHTRLYAVYTHSSHAIEIIGTTVIPEHSTLLIYLLPILVLTGTLFLTIERKRHPHTLDVSSQSR